MRARPLPLLGLCLALAARLPAEKLLVLDPAIVSPDSAAVRALAVEALAGAAQLINQRYANSLTAEYLHEAKGARAEFTTHTIVVLNPEAAPRKDAPPGAPGPPATIVVKVIRASDGRESEGFPIMGRLGPDSARHLAGALFHQWASFHGYLLDRLGEAPAYVDELPLDALSAARLGYPGGFVPMSLALSPSSTLLVGTPTLCLEMDRHFRLVSEPGRELHDGGQYGYALGVAVTPAGSLFFKNFQAGRILRWQGAGARPQSWNVGTQFMGALAALSDGSAVAADLGMKQALRLEGTRREALDLLAGPDSFITGLAAGPEGELWVWDHVERRVRIYTPRGQLLDSVVPITAQPLVPSSFCVLPDGSFVAFARGELWRFRRDGLPLWRTAELAGPLVAASGPVSAVQNASVAADARTGLLYVADVQGRRLVELLDRGLARQSGASAAVEERLVGLNAEFVRLAVQGVGKQQIEQRQAALLLEKARIYEGLESIEMARAAAEQVLEIDPGHPEATAALARFELARLRRSAEETAARARRTLEELGPESARAEYTRALQLFEQLLRLAPGDAQATEARRDLKARFEQRDSAEAGASLEIDPVRVEDLFPSLLNRYAQGAVGAVTVKNRSRETLRDLRAGLKVERYMDAATEGPALASLAPGATAQLELRAVLNTRVFDLQEDLPVQARVEVSFSGSGGRQRQAAGASLTLHRRSALVWDETGKLASFITPNEDTVGSFARRAVAAASAGAPAGSPAGTTPWRLPPRLLRAMRVCDTLGAYGIVYVEDPDSPISRILGQPAVVDTVRFPRDTLAQRTGDCDDTTALLASALEAVGVRTAIMTSPGHVFLAFDTGDPAANLWLFTASGRQAIAHDGTVWLPVETTALSQGFGSAWRKAGDLLVRHQGQTEFLAVRELRSRFPPLPLPAAPVSIVDPPGPKVEALSAASLGELEASLYTGALAALQGRLKQEKGARAIAVRNRIGVLHARFGRDGLAEQELRACLAEDPGYTPALANLANLKILRGETREAQQLIDALRRRSPELAEHYAAVAPAGGSRASGEQPPLTWPAGE